MKSEKLKKEKGNSLSSRPTTSPTMEHFPLAELPYEIILRIVHTLDERDNSPTFPTGPSDSLLALSAVNRSFSNICRPRIFRSVKFQPVPSGPHPPAYREARSLRALSQLIEESQQTQPIKVQELSIEELSSFWGDPEEGEDEMSDVVKLVRTLIESGLQVLFLKGLAFTREETKELFDAISSAPRLSAIRFNQVDITASKSTIDGVPSLPKIRTLQIMHGSSLLVSTSPIIL